MLFSQCHNSCSAAIVACEATIDACQRFIDACSSTVMQECALERGRCVQACSIGIDTCSAMMEQCQKYMNATDDTASINLCQELMVKAQRYQYACAALLSCIENDREVAVDACFECIQACNECTSVIQTCIETCK